MDKQNVVYTYNGYHSALKRKVISNTTALIQLHDIMLSEISQSQKDKHCMISLL